MTLKRPCPSGSASLSSWTDLHSLEQALFDRLCFIYMCVSICYFRPRWARRRGSPWPWRAEAPLHGSARLLSAVLSGGAEALGAQASGAATHRLQSTDSTVAVHGLSCWEECGIFLDQGSNPCPLHWQADSVPLSHQGSPSHFLLYFETSNFTFPSCSSSTCTA